MKNEQANDNQTAINQAIKWKLQDNQKSDFGKQNPLHYQEKDLLAKIFSEEEKQRSKACFWIYPKAFERSLFRRSIAHYTSFRSLVGSARLFNRKKSKEINL